MRVAYLDAANYEFDEATAYYNEERAGLGFEFADEIKQTLERIKKLSSSLDSTIEAHAAMPGPSFSL